LIFHVFGAIAHFERRLISERTKDGIAAARAKGKKPGRQPLDMKKVEAAIKLVEAQTSPSEAARHNSVSAAQPSIASCDDSGSVGKADPCFRSVHPCRCLAHLSRFAKKS
jgi:Resolvase, N terminal domain